MEKIKVAVNAAIAISLAALVIYCVRLDRKAEKILDKVKAVEESFNSIDLNGVRSKVDEIFKITKDPTSIIRRRE